jgi:hypothetical protein
MTMNETPRKPVDDANKNPGDKPRPKRCCGGWPKILLALVAVGACLLALSTWSSCSSYETAWQEKVQAPQGDLLAGKWEGTWQSDDDQEKLSAVIKKEHDDKYVADFFAKTPAYIPFDDYTEAVVLSVQKGPDRWTFSGSADKGFFKGGVYKFEGWTDGETFYSTFSSSFYSGTYTMKRVEEPVQ